MKTCNKKKNCCFIKILILEVKSLCQSLPRCCAAFAAADCFLATLGSFSCPVSSEQYRSIWFGTHRGLLLSILSKCQCQGAAVAQSLCCWSDGSLPSDLKLPGPGRPFPIFHLRFSLRQKKPKGNDITGLKNGNWNQIDLCRCERRRQRNSLKSQLAWNDSSQHPVMPPSVKPATQNIG